MAEEGEVSRSSFGTDEDFAVEDNGEDYEGTIDEEEEIGTENYGDELRALEDEGQLSIEELRKRYGLPPECSSPQTEEEEEDGQGCSAEAQSSEDDTEVGVTSAYFAVEEDEDTVDDKDYEPPNPHKSQIRVDPVMYQADIPDYDPLAYDKQLRNATFYNPQLLWIRDVNVSTERLDEFLTAVAQFRKTQENLDMRVSEARDDEDAMFTLMKEQGNTDVVMNRYPWSRANGPTRTMPMPDRAWTSHENHIFEHLLATHGKNFSLLQKDLPERTVGELVNYYYKWKLTTRYRTLNVKNGLCLNAFTRSVLHCAPNAAHFVHPSNGEVAIEPSTDVAIETAPPAPESTDVSGQQLSTELSGETTTEDDVWWDKKGDSASIALA